MSEFIEIHNFTDESSLFMQWNPLTSIPLSISYAIAILVSVFSRLAFIFYILKVAPKRPINFNFLVDQVSIFFKIDLKTFETVIFRLFNSPQSLSHQ